MNVDDRLKDIRDKYEDTLKNYISEYENFKLEVRYIFNV